MNYTLRELMVAAAAREIRDGDKVFVGMRLPLLGFAVAKETHAPNALGIFENGVIRDWPALEIDIYDERSAQHRARALLRRSQRRDESTCRPGESTSASSAARRLIGLAT